MKRNKNGFVFIETIIAIIILMVSFLTLFNMYFRIFNKLDTRYEYDNIISIYKAYNVKTALETYSNFKTTYASLVNDEILIKNLGIRTNDLFIDNNNIENYMNLLEKLGVSNVFIIKDINEYKETCIENFNDTKCNHIIFNNNTKDYINSINEDSGYILFVETMLDNNGNICTSGCHKEYTYVYLENGQSSFIDSLIKIGGLWSSGLEGDGYRYIGSGNYNSSTTPKNFMCFGTTDKNACIANPDKYMYRIVGVFPDKSGKKHLKLIKLSTIGNYPWHSNKNEDVKWQDSSLYNGLNGDYFLTNTTYDYMQNSDWTNKIYNWNWIAFESSRLFLSADTLTADKVYLKEIARINNDPSDVHNEVASKIGIIYASDYLLSLGDISLVPNSSSDLKKSWLHQSNNFSYEYDHDHGDWTIASFGYWEYYGNTDAYSIRNDGSLMYTIIADGAITYSVRPSFYLNSDIEKSSGTGTYEDPYIIK